MSDHEESQRIDVWLFRTRLFKSRRMAADLVSSGKLRLERHGQVLRVRRSSFLVRTDDVLTYVQGENVLRITILSCPERRGPASEARTHYSLDSTA